MKHPVTLRGDLVKLAADCGYALAAMKAVSTAGCPGEVMGEAIERLESSHKRISDALETM